MKQRDEECERFKESSLAAISLSNEPLEKQIIREGTMVPAIQKRIIEAICICIDFLRIRLFIDTRPPLLRYNRQLTITWKEME